VKSVAIDGSEPPQPTFTGRNFTVSAFLVGEVDLAELGQKMTVGDTRRQSVVAQTDQSNTKRRRRIEKKLRWFDRGAAAFERAFPGRLAAQFGADAGPRYVCPICDFAFIRAAVEAGVLTAEHVPPESFGGRERLLTCKRCNDSAGRLLDAHARRKENLADFLKGREIKRPMKVTIEHPVGNEVQARLNIEADGTTVFNVVRRANSRAAITAFQAAEPPRPPHPIKVKFTEDRFVEFAAKMSWFRSGFLILFDIFGYRYSLDPALEVVKRQILTPPTDLPIIPCFTIQRLDADPKLEWSSWRILMIPEPRSLGVVFDRYILVYPYPGDLSLYDRIQEHIISLGDRRPPRFNARSFEPVDNEPRFGFEIEDRPARNPDGG